MTTQNKPTVVFVFGSNDEGRHGKGAAFHAYKYWGAKYGQAHGRQGNAYAICTTSLSYKAEDVVTLEEIENDLKIFARHAWRKSKESFLLTAVGTGLAGFDTRDIAKIVERIAWPENVFISGKLVNSFNFIKA